MMYKINDRQGEVFLLAPTSSNGESYYEVYAHSENDTFGKYIGDFETPQRFGTKEFQIDFEYWIED